MAHMNSFGFQRALHALARFLSLPCAASPQKKGQGLGFGGFPKL